MAKFGIGQAVRRVEDVRFITGAGRYVDDISLPGMVHGVVLLSPHAHARIRKIDTAKAKAAPGVLLVLTGADAAADKLGAFTAAMMPEDIGAPKGHRIHQQVLQAEKVRFVGDRVAFVVAETAAQARDAAEMIEVDYEVLPAVAWLEDAAKDGAPNVGGGFGLKGGPFPDDVLVLWASKKLKRPVKWVATRSESMMNDHTGRDLISHGELALDEKGKILAIRSQSLFQIGAYFVGPGMVSGLFSL